MVQCLKGERLLDSSFEDGFQQWLAYVLGLRQENVRPAVELDLTKLPDLVDAAVFMPTGLKATPINDHLTQEGQKVDYSGQVQIQVTICGPHARELAILLCDVFTVGQSSEGLHKYLGLGYVSAGIAAFTLEPRGQMLCPRADVTILFNYRYSRLWAVCPLESAEAFIYRD